MKITKFRTAAIIYPWLSLECEVVDGEKSYYANISVNSKGRKEELKEDNHWCYRKPLDRLGIDENENKIDYDKDCEDNLCEISTTIYQQMIDFWNENPVFVDSLDWKEWPKK